MVGKNRLFSWLKLWHPSKKSSTDDAVEGSSYTQHHHHGNQRVRHALVKYGKRGWLPHWNLLHLDKRSCAQTKDVRTDGPRRNDDHRQGTVRSQLVVPVGEKTDQCSTQRKLQTVRDENVKESSSLKVNECTGVSRRGASGDSDVAAGVDLQQHKSVIKNRVLPLTAQEEMHFSTAFKLKTTNLCSVDEENPISIAASKGVELESFKRAGSISFKKLSFPRVFSTPVSPRSPSEAKWKMLLSCSSQSTSPTRSPRYFYQPEWNSPRVEATHQKGSFSTMGSPWNSQAGGHRFHNTRTSSFKGSYKQGEWITTDTDFVVLEL